jgi:hypothetical protein
VNQENTSKHQRTKEPNSFFKKLKQTPKVTFNEQKKIEKGPNSVRSVPTYQTTET